MAWPAIAAAAGGIISGGIGLIQSGRQAKQTRQNIRDTHRQNLEMAEYAHSKDLEMWNRMNEYNTPLAQMERFKEAGLNPHLAYSQGSPGQATGMPEYNAPTADFSGRQPLDLTSAMDGLSKYIGLKQQGANVRLTERQVQSEITSMTLEGARTDGILQENIIRSIEATVAQTIINNHSLKDIAKGRIAGMKADDWLKQATAQIRQWEAGLTEQNINPRDSITVRMIIDMLEMFGFSPRQIRSQLR